MSQCIRNKSCEICGRIEVGLVEMSVRKTKHYLCYSCYGKFRIGRSWLRKNEFDRESQWIWKYIFYRQRTETTVKLRFIGIINGEYNNRNN